ncbi:hypothetical protein IW143_004319 [Coemansia sp. RSA 520]|nr:hypothetical protein IW143_004319 [Coemansia sp. RSA 520]
MNDINSEGHVNQFVTASANILRTVTGDVGSKAHIMSQHMVSTIDSAENSTSKHMAALEASLRSLHTELCTAQDAMSVSQSQLIQCTSESTLSLESVRAAAGAAHDSVAAIERMPDPWQAMHAHRVAQMTQRNDEFERTLRRDHHEFSQMHARRLAHVFSGLK